jgi:predicted nucleic acid-binding protein
MGVTTQSLLDRLAPGPVALDTAIFIYLIEEHPAYLPKIVPLFEAIADGRLKAVTSALTLLETLVIPLRTNNLELAEQYEKILTHSLNLKLVELSIPVLRTAAKLRAVTKTRTPDAIQLAAAIHADCTSFLTNDRKMPAYGGIRIVQLHSP